VRVNAERSFGSRRNTALSGSRPGIVSSAVDSAPAPAADAWCDDEFIYVETVDGRVVKRELPEFLLKLTPGQRRNCQVMGLGTDIYWPDIDEWLGVDWVFGVPEEVIYDLAGSRNGPFRKDET
jgi:hypothetical protein